MIQKILKIAKKILLTIGIFFLFGILLFIFKGDPVEFTDEHKKYIGNWKGDEINLIINKDFHVDYQDNKGSLKTSVYGPIISFNESTFSIGFSFLKTTFNIDKKPYKELGIWKMTIDGNELSKTIDVSDLPIPETEELNKLTNGFTELFNNSVLKNNYQLLFDGMSQTRRSQTDVDFLRKTIKPKRKNINLDEVVNKNIIYSKPPYINDINGDKFLILKGYYLSKPRYKFHYSFVYEYPEWKIAGFKFN